MKKYEVLVIGGGPAAITIAKNIGHKKTVGIIRPEDHSMIYCAMPYVIEGILPMDKTLKSDKIVTETGAKLIRGSVEKVDFASRTVTVKNGDAMHYERLVIATGATPIVPQIEGANLAGVLVFKTEEDLKSIISIVEKGIKKAVIVGAGAIGIELSQALNKIGIETYLVDIADSILPNMMDYEMVEDAEGELTSQGVKLHLRNKVVSLAGNKFVEKVVLENGDTIPLVAPDHCSEDGFDGIKGIVVFAVGMTPALDLFKKTELEMGRTGIKVNERMKTNIEGVYAVGDCVEFSSGITGSTTVGKLATNAVPMGKIAAKNILGENRSYKGFFNGAATKIGKYFVGGTGLTEKAARDRFDVVTGYAELTTAFPIMPFSKKIKMKLVADKKTGKILGGQVTSEEPVTDKIDLITMAVEYDIPVEELVHFSYSSQPYQSFFPANNLLVQAAENTLAKME